MNSHIFRTKLKWIEEGEKKSKFFMALEQILYQQTYINSRGKW